jgi:hypothetical protein
MRSSRSSFRRKGQATIIDTDEPIRPDTTLMGWRSLSPLRMMAA